MSKPQELIASSLRIVFEESMIRALTFYWLLSEIPQNPNTCLRGPPGFSGRNGINGRNGLPGRDGRDGTKGEKGVAGPQGLVNNDARLILRESLTGQRHDRVPTESSRATWWERRCGNKWHRRRPQKVETVCMEKWRQPPHWSYSGTVGINVKQNQGKMWI